MSWLAPILDSFAAGKPCGYRVGLPPAAEPTALAALALVGHQRRAAAEPLSAWLLSQQADEGRVGVLDREATPAWATGLAVAAWCALGRGAGGAAASDRYSSAVARATGWLLATRGDAPPQAEYTGHDTTLVGWPWVLGTHSWIEPTALGLLALKATGYADHPRAREAARLLIDRLLPNGGCNYGNTLVLGRTLRPHVMPSGLAMLALAGEKDDSGHMARTLTYLEGSITSQTTAASLACALLGLCAQGRDIERYESLLARAAERTARHGAPAQRLALLALAALGADCPLITLTSNAMPHNPPVGLPSVSAAP